MKKIFTLCLALFSAAATFAQVDDTFIFVDQDGNEIPSGSTVTVSQIEEDPFTGSSAIHSGVSVKNTIGDKQAVGGTYTVNRIDNGAFQICFPMVCKEGITSTGSGDLEPGYMEANEKKNIQSEWYTEGEGLCNVTLQLALYEITKNKWGVESIGNKIDTDDPMPYINIEFANGVTGINGILSPDNTEVEAVYSADGKRLQAPQKGLNIVRLTNGKTVKVVK